MSIGDTTDGRRVGPVPAVVVLAALATVFAVVTDLATPALALLVPAAVLAVAVGALAVSAGLDRLRAVCAVLVLRWPAPTRSPSANEHRPAGHHDRCRRVEATALAGPRAPGMRT